MGANRAYRVTITASVRPAGTLFFEEAGFLVEATVFGAGFFAPTLLATGRWFATKTVFEPVFLTGVAEARSFTFAETVRGCTSSAIFTGGKSLRGGSSSRSCLPE